MANRNIRSILKLSFIAILLSTFFIGCSSSKSAVHLNADDIKDMVSNKKFVFIANRVNPLRGRSRQLTTQYDVRVKNDSLESFLPYFGRAYQAPMDPSQGGIQFTSTNFSYEINENKGWDVIIKPHDYNEVQQFLFKIFQNGNATLNVTSTNRDPITFNGYVEKINNEE